MKKTFPSLLKFGCIITALFGSFIVESAPIKHVAITAIVEHPSLNQIRDGVKDELISQGYQLDKDLIINYQNAQGSSATAGQIAKQFVASKPDAIVAIATPSAQSIAALTKTIPIVFSGVTDPVSAKLTKSWDATGTNITGVSDLLDISVQIEFMKSIMPNLKTVGYVYSPGEINSTTVLKQLKNLLAKENIEIIAAPAQRSADVLIAALSLKGKVDLIYTTTDNNVVSAYSSLVKFANESKTPLLASFPDAVERGAVAALGMSYYDMGHQSGKIVARILKGEKAGDIAPEIGKGTHLVLNLDAAKLQGVKLSDQVIQSAYQVIGNK